MKNKLFVYIGLIVLFLSVSGCGNKYREIKRLLGREVNFDFIDDSLQCDSTIRNKLASPIKIVVFVDTIFCTPCFSKYIVTAAEFLKYMDNDSVMYCIITGKNLAEDLRIIPLVNNTPNMLILPDYDYKFIKSNSLGQLKDQFNTFYLENNIITLVGDPVRNRKIGELYKKRAGS